MTTRDPLRVRSLEDRTCPAALLADDSFTTVEDVPLADDLNVLSNDAGDGPLAVTAVNGSPAGVGVPVAINGGTVTLNADGSFALDLEPGFDGTTRFLYAATDGDTEDTASVRIDVAETPTQRPYVGMIGDVLTVVGTDGSDFIQFLPVEGDESATLMVSGLTGWLGRTFDGVRVIRVVSLGGNENVIMDPSMTIPMSLEDSVGYNYVRLGQGDNVVKLGDGYQIVQAGDGDDVIEVGAGGSNVNAGGGDNLISAGLGYDDITAGDGNDVILVGDGGSTVRAGGGFNAVFAGAGFDFVTAGAMNDTVAVGDGGSQITDAGGSNAVSAGDGRDVVFAGDGIDFIDIGPGGGRVFAGGGDDIVLGGSGDDELFGQDGRDVILGLGGNDLIDGGAGVDAIVGGEGADLIFGGPGDDRVITGTASVITAAGEDPTAALINRLRAANLDPADRLDDVIIESDEDADSVIGGEGADLIFYGVIDVLWGDGDDENVLG